jgi:hypothetical protein
MFRSQGTSRGSCFFIAQRTGQAAQPPRQTDILHPLTPPQKRELCRQKSRFATKPPAPPADAPRRPAHHVGRLGPLGPRPTRRRLRVERGRAFAWQPSRRTRRDRRLSGFRRCRPSPPPGHPLPPAIAPECRRGETPRHPSDLQPSVFPRSITANRRKPKSVGQTLASPKLTPRPFPSAIPPLRLRAPPLSPPAHPLQPSRPASCGKWKLRMPLI